MAEGKKNKGGCHSDPSAKSFDFFCAIELANASRLLPDMFCAAQNYCGFFSRMGKN